MISNSKLKHNIMGLFKPAWMSDNAQKALNAVEKNY